ncbi:hypothetical protein D3C81_1573010 [compost metagenome]
MTQLSSSDAEANWLEDSEICRIVSRKLCCMLLSACNSRAGSSLPLMLMSPVRSPPATTSATPNDCASGNTMLRVSNRARPMVISAVTPIITPTHTREFMNTNRAASVARLALCLFSSTSSRKSTAISSAKGLI